MNRATVSDVILEVNAEMLSSKTLYLATAAGTLSAALLAIPVLSPDESAAPSEDLTGTESATTAPVTDDAAAQAELPPSNTDAARREVR